MFWARHLPDILQIYIHFGLGDYEDMLMTCITSLMRLNGHPTGINLGADDFALGLCGITIGYIMVITSLPIINKSFVIQNMCSSSCLIIMSLV